MPLIRSAIEMYRQPRNATIESPAVPLTDTSLIELFGGAPATAGVTVTETSAMGMTAVWRAVNLISSTAASLPLHAYRDDDDARVRMPRESASARLLREPHPDLTAFEWKELIFAHICLWGNAYIRILRNQLGQITELWPLHPGRVRVGREDEAGTKFYMIDGKYDTPYTDREILHIPGFGYDGICGVSPIRAARQGLSLALAAEQFGASLFGNGSLATGILQTEQRLEQVQANALRDRWKQRASGMSNAHDVVVLDRGAKFQQLSIPPEDAQFIESRKFQVEEVCRMYGIPPHMMASVEKSTSWGTGIEQQAIGFVVWSFAPGYLNRVEARLTKLIRPAAAYAKFNVDGLLRGDSAARADFYTKMWNIGAVSTNDVRAKEEQPPVEGGDTRYRPLNMGVLGEPDPVVAVPDQVPAEETENA